MKLISLLFLFATSSIYTLQFSDVDGVSKSMSSCQGKKILIVNIATGSSKVSQLAELHQLQQQYSDSLVVLAFPSNSFGHESKTNAEIKQFCQGYGVTFTIASKGDVAGANKQAVYQWLTNMAENSVMGYEVAGDFQKFLIDKDGNLVGVFSSSVTPQSSELINAINQ